HPRTGAEGARCRTSLLRYSATLLPEGAANDRTSRMSSTPWSRPWAPAWAHGATSHVGLVRAVNEDSLLVAPPLVVVADGMGGHAGGDVASRLVVEEFETLADRDFTPRTGRDAIVECLVRAQSRLKDHVERRAAEARIGHAGTTVVAALLVEGREGATWLVAN